jgi:hypothetical protein
LVPDVVIFLTERTPKSAEGNAMDYLVGCIRILFAGELEPRKTKGHAECSFGKSSKIRCKSAMHELVGRIRTLKSSSTKLRLKFADTRKV